jgi:chromosome segregation ATPase
MEELSALQVSMDSALAAKDEELSTKNGELAARAEELSDLQASMDSALAAKDAQLTIKDNDLIAREEEIAALSTREMDVSAVQGRVVELTRALDASRSRVFECEEVISEWDCRLADQKLLLLQKDDMITDQKEQLRDLDRCIANKYAELKQMEKVEVELTAKLAERDRQLTERDVCLTEWDRQLGTKDKLLQEKEATIATLEARMATAEKDLSHSRETHSHAAEELESTREKLALKVALLTEAETRGKELADMGAHLARELEKKEMETSVLQDESAQQRAEMHTADLATSELVLKLRQENEGAKTAANATITALRQELKSEKEHLIVSKQKTNSAARLADEAETRERDLRSSLQEGAAVIAKLERKITKLQSRLESVRSDSSKTKETQAKLQSSARAFLQRTNTALKNKLDKIQPVQDTENMDPKLINASRHRSENSTPATGENDSSAIQPFKKFQVLQRVEVPCCSDPEHITLATRFQSSLSSTRLMQSRVRDLEGEVERTQTALREALSRVFEQQEQQRAMLEGTNGGEASLVSKTLSSEHKIDFLRQAFCHFTQASSEVDMTRSSRVICRLLSLDNVAERTVMQGVARLVPAFSLLSSMDDVQAKFTSCLERSLF